MDEFAPELRKLIDETNHPSMTEQAANTSHPRSQPCIKIRTQKFNKSLTTQSDMLHQLDPDEYAMAAIQELYLDFNHNSQATQKWFTRYPKEHNVKPNKTRSIMFMFKKFPLTVGHRLMSFHPM